MGLGAADNSAAAPSPTFSVAYLNRISRDFIFHCKGIIYATVSLFHEVPAHQKPHRSNLPDAEAHQSLGL